MNPIRAGAANVHHHVLDWIGAQGFTESDRAVLLEEDVRWERGYHTRGVSLAGPRGSKDSEARAVRTACGGIVESAPERQQLLGPPHSQRAQGLRGTSVSG
jgi:hypothetical protein